jgi:alpha-L-rhamnosidase
MVVDKNNQLLDSTMLLFWCSLFIFFCHNNVLNASNNGSGGIRVGSLTTEYLKSPVIGVDRATPRVSWKLHVDHDYDTTTTISSSMLRQKRDVVQQSYQLQMKVTPTSSATLSSGCCGWKDCGWVKSNQTNLVYIQCGGVTPISTNDLDVAWKVSVKLDDGSLVESGIAHFRTGIMDGSSWKGQWITGGNATALLRKEFTLSKGVNKYATLFVSGIGYHHVYLDGIKVGDHQLDPGWTDFEKRVWYSSYDVTDMLQENYNNYNNDSTDGSALSHTIAVMLGNGWWSCGPWPGTNQPGCRENPPQLILQLHVDGEPVFWSDKTWSASDDTPVLYNSLYNGETYDARIAERIEGWMLLGYDSSSWSSAVLADSVANKAKLESQLFEPIRHIATLDPVSITVANHVDDDGNFIQTVDFGQNHAAVIRLKKVVCPRGRVVTLRHAELVMHPPYGPYDGTTIYVDNLRTANATDKYICKGDPRGESYIPLFTQHGFRYVQVLGLNYTLDPSDLEAVELHSDVTQTSFISFSDPLLDEIQKMVMWGLKSNLMSVQTDCNNRDERRGWMGDAALTAEAAVLSYGMGAFYTRWLDQMVDAQNMGDGSMPNFVPPLGTTDGAPNWQTAYVMIIYVMLVHYGDFEIVFRHHHSLVRYFDFLETNYKKTGMAGKFALKF